MNICVIGTGYVGLVTGACFAELGHNVWCVDIDEEKVEALNKGIIPIYEPDLDKLVKTNFVAGRLSFTTSISEALTDSLFVFIAVATPPGEDGSADLSQVLGVAREIGKSMNEYKIIVDKSTVPVGTAKRVKEIIKEVIVERSADLEFDVVSNPEFLKEGAAIEDFMHPDRIVVGVDNQKSAELMRELYQPLIQKGYQLITIDVLSAEMTKYAANAMLATRISFMNEIARICDAAGADVEMVRRGIGSDTRIGPKFLQAGIGYGGSCFPKDVKALIQTAAELGVEPKILEAVETVNNKQKTRLVEMITDRFGKNLAGLVFAVWGLAFKPCTDDMREAPSIEIINNLRNRGAYIQVHDPVAMSTAKALLGDESIIYLNDKYDALQNAVALLVVTEWGEYREPDYETLRNKLNDPIVFDGRNIYDPMTMKQQSFEYYAIGRNGTSIQEMEESN